MTLAALPLKRAIQRELETPIAKGILGGQFTGGHTVAVDVEPVGEQRPETTATIPGQGHQASSRWRRRLPP